MYLQVTNKKVKKHKKIAKNFVNEGYGLPHFIPPPPKKKSQPHDLSEDLAVDPLNHSSGFRVR